MMSRKIEELRGRHSWRGMLVLELIMGRPFYEDSKLRRECTKKGYLKEGKVTAEV